MSFHRPDNQQVCWAVYWPSVMRDQSLAGLGYTAEDCARWEGLAMKCFDRGEPIWMAALEVKVAIDVLGTNERPCYATREEKTPLQLAKRVVRM